MTRRLAVVAFVLVAVMLSSGDGASADPASSRHPSIGARIDSGYAHSCAILGNGGMRCWGYNAHGELGLGNTGNVGETESPASVGPVGLGVGRSAVAVASGTYHNCAILDNGSVKCWGQGVGGALGYGNTDNIGDNETLGSIGPVDLGVGRTATSLAAGEAFNCAILDNGTVRCWGFNSFGALGYGNTNDIGDNESPASAGPVNFGAGRTAVSISSTGSYSCAILDNGTVKCWGFAGFGTLGYGNGNTIGDDETPASVPAVDLGAGRTAVALSAGYLHACAILDNGAVRCWGKGEYGKLGYGNTSNVGVPSSVGTVNLGPGRTAVAISTGLTHTCAILDDGTVKCWGEGAYGELGYGNSFDVGDDETPASVGPVNLGPGRTAVAISTGQYFTCALLDNGTVRCWGEAYVGRLGYGNPNRIGDNELPSTVGPVDLAAASGALETTAGSAHSCARFSDGSVRCWGSGADGKLGYGSIDNVGDNENVGSAGVVDLGGEGAIELAAGESHTCALLAGGAVRCWGLNSSGQLGYGNTTKIGDNELPSTVAPVSLGESAVRIAAGGSHTCALLASGSVRCWGLNSSGELGYANTTQIGDNEAPGSVGPVALGGSATGITAGDSHTCARLSDGSLRCWGTGSDGRLGYGFTGAIGDNESPSTAGAVNIGGSAESVAAGGSHSCGLLTSGAVRCWGASFRGQLGYGNTDTIGDNELPSAAGPVGLGRNASSITTGGFHTCALLDNGTVRCWGNGGNGRLGYGNTNDIGDNELPSTAGPVDLGGVNAMGVSAGGMHTCATQTNGSVKCWGLNSSGQLGYGNTTTIGDDETPAAVAVDFIDDPPTAVNDSKTLDEDSGATPINALANDTDPDLGPKAIQSVTQPAHGSAAITGEGAMLTYTPAANYCNDPPGTTPDTFTYTLNGGSTATVSVTVTCVDDPPVAQADAKTLTEDSGPTSIDVLANDSDADGGPKLIATATAPSHGTVAITGGGLGLTYQPAANYCNDPPGTAPDSFSYELNGGSTAAVSVTVTCVDDLPVAVNDSETVAEDSTATAIDVLANDTDVDGGPMSIQSVTQPADGAVAITGGGSGLTYVPDPNQCGADSFTYTLNGGSTATVAVTVDCVDDAPLAVADVKTLSEDAASTPIDVLANDTDTDAGPMSVQAVTSPSHGSAAITGGGTGLTYAPAANYCGLDSFDYELNGGSTATVSVTVTCADDPPAAVNDADTVAEDSGANAIDVLANDTDVDGGPKLVAGKTNGTNGAVTIIGGGAGITYTPNPDYCGADSFTYNLNGGSTATVTIAVTCVDDPLPPSGENGGQGGGGSTIVQTPQGGPTGPVVNVTPGVGVVSGRRHPRIAVKGGYAFFTLTCKLTDRDCVGTVTISASIPSIALGPTMRSVVMVKGRFRVGSGRSVLVRAKLTKRGLEALSGKRSLRGVAASMTIADAGNGEKGSIVVNLVRRPKASVLPGAGASR